MIAQEELHAFIEFSGVILEITGVAAILVGVVYATAAALWRIHRSAINVFQSFRNHLGRGILLGLEFLVAGDIIKTVAVTPTYYGLGVLAIVVAVRTFLSFTLEVEMTGRWPWQGNRQGPSG